MLSVLLTPRPNSFQGSSVGWLRATSMATPSWWCPVAGKRWGVSRYDKVWCCLLENGNQLSSLLSRFMGPTWGPSGAERTQVGPMLAPWTLLSGMERLPNNWLQCILRNAPIPFLIIFRSASRGDKGDFVKSSDHHPSINRIELQYGLILKDDLPVTSGAESNSDTYITEVLSSHAHECSFLTGNCLPWDPYRLSWCQTASLESHMFVDSNHREIFRDHWLHLVGHVTKITR